MYIWETSGDERVRGTPKEEGGIYPNARPSHYAMDSLLCRWDDSSVYSEDGGRTWIDRPPGAVLLHPGDDYQCRCTAIAYWQELVGEADEQIDLLSVSGDNILGSDKGGLNVMNPPKAQTSNESLQQRQEARERRRRQENAKKAKEAADELFPGEKWKQVEGEERIYLSPHRPVGKKSNYKDELRDALILVALGSMVYLTPENRDDPGKKFDAIVNGQRMEFKNISGNANTLTTQFLRSREQAPNVFLNLEKSNLTKHEIISALYGVRNSGEYGEKNQFKGGKIILKIKGQKNLIFLNVDSLKAKKQ
jgi:hypothetical protein